MVRLATVADLPSLEPLAREFYAASRFLKRFDMGRFTRLWTNLLENGHGVIFLAGAGDRIVGAICGVVYPEPYSGDLIATEFAWFVRPDCRGEGMRLYRAFEEWARMKRCTQIQMVHLSDSMPDRLKAVYEHLGYEPVETRYVKELH